MLRIGTAIRTLQKVLGHMNAQILMRYLSLASDEAIEMRRVNRRAGKRYAIK
jgi:hypothetical protein